MGISTAPAPAGVVTGGTGLLLIGPASAIADLTKPSVAELSADTFLDFTYHAKVFDRKSGQTMFDDERWTLAQALKLPGTKTDEISLQYAFGQDPAEPVAELDEMLIEGEEYVIIQRSAIKKNTPLTAGQKVDVIPVTCGRKAKDQPTQNSVWTRTVQLPPFSEVLDDVELVA